MKKVLSLAYAISLVGSSLLLADTSDMPPSIPGVDVHEVFMITEPIPVVKDESKSIVLTIGLTPGWNLVSLPGYSRYSLDDMFGVGMTNSDGIAMTSFIKAVWVFNVNTGKWMTYVPGNRNDYFRDLKPGEGIWVNAKYNASYEFTATVGEEKIRYSDGNVVMDNVPPMPWK